MVVVLPLAPEHGTHNLETKEMILVEGDLTYVGQWAETSQSFKYCGLVYGKGQDYRSAVGCPPRGTFFFSVARV